MKSIMLPAAIAATLFFAACTNEPKSTSSSTTTDKPSDIFTKVYSTENLPLETFTIPGNRDTSVKGKSGIVLSISKNTFVNADGSPLSGPVTIELKEALTPSDIVMANLTTTFDGQMLQTGGMLYVNARSANNPVLIAEGKSIGVEVPTDSVQKDMQIFEGIEDSKGIKWVNPQDILVKKKQDIPVKKKKNTQINKESKTEQMPAVVPLIEMVPEDAAIGAAGGSEKVMLEDGEIVAAEPNIAPEKVLKRNIQARKGHNSFIQDQQTTYIFSLKKLGWANIDRLYHDPRTKQVELITSIDNHADFNIVCVTMIISNMYLPGYQKQDNTFSFSHGDHEAMRLPVGENAIIIATAYKDGVPFFALRRVTISEKQTVNFTLEKTTMDGLKNELQKI